MSFPPTLGPPPLPPPWTEHLAPGGQIYYYNPNTQESTYIRPLPTFQNLPASQRSKPKKEKPLTKTQIPGTDWIRVKTTEGNVFYSHKVKKQSVWTVPEEIKEAVELLEKEESRDDSTMKTEEELEVERIKSQVQEAVKKRKKSVDDEELDEVVISKKARIPEDDEEEEESDEEDDREEEDWEREAAAQLAAEAEEHKKREEEEAKRVAEAAEAEALKAKEAQLNMPERVDLSIEEAKALFKTLLREKDINPLHPWDTSLPKFVSDPRYVLLPSVTARREAFDEYCRDRARELRQEKVKQEKASDPQEEFENLLKAEVKSTRTSWTDFRRTWKKDRRFYSWGRDDREREKRFREFIRELGEKKKAAAQKAEADFFALLKERVKVEGDMDWKKVKRDLVQDPRYDAVGSSSLREELFNTFLKASGSIVETGRSAENGEVQPSKDVEKAESKRDRKERAVKEREEKVKAERERVQASIGRSKMELSNEEGELEFKTLLTDAIRDPQISWDAALPQLKTDPRFLNSPLPHLSNLHALFESHAPSLATTFESLPLSSLLSALPVTKLGFDSDALESEFEKWQRERTQKARTAFDEMLSENSFVEFWGRLRKIGGEGVDGGVKADEEGLAEDEGEFSGGKVDMKSLAKSVDIQEMVKVLKNDKRYIMFDHVPEQRERWLRNYLAQLSAPKMSVHVPS
ncbi:hypothetical protein D9758_001067 [Tetrapyrgos nigripes]|uniref:Transcription elongation regulator 1 n=1 Tax=Tetrapyrgos nigripes TaxID=182062 RepID=A0A8H5GSH7_9AGAR|nr:hypothetical protein D9758_001067 [Tetrapyrgos nigripes]